MAGVTAQCARCGRPLADGYVCTPDAQTLADTLLTAAGHAEDASTLDVRGAHLGSAPGGNGDTRLPDLTRSTRYARAAGAITTWARTAIEETGRRPRWRPAIGPLCPPLGARCIHGSCEAIRRQTPPDTVALAAAWLAKQVGWLRKHPAAAEAFTDLHAACDDLARLVDVPPEKELIGVCDCGRGLYAVDGATFVTCRQATCKLRWNVAESRDILRRALDGKLVTASHAARLAQYLDGDRTQLQIRKLITAWVARGQLLAVGEIERDPTDDEVDAAIEAGMVPAQHVTPTYRFGDVADRLARTPRRQSAAA